MSTSPWLTPTPSSTSTPGGNGNMSTELDPWAAAAGSDFLRASSSSASHLRSRKSPSPAFVSASGSTLSTPPSKDTTKASQVVERHPLRSPSPSGHTTLNRPSQPARRPSAVASEWKAIGAGLAGLFNGSSTSSDPSSYRWPADPVSSPSNQGDELHKGHSNDRIESTLDRLEDWFGLKDSRATPSPAPAGTLRQHSQPPIPPLVRVTKAPGTNTQSEEIRVLIHPVSPADTLPSLALHYGADIHVLRKSNKLWPGDPVQIRKVIFVPVDSCKHRPPNAEIKILPSQGGAISTTGADLISGLAFVPREEEDDMSGGLVDLATSGSQSTLTPLASMADPASDFMPETNKSYSDHMISDTSSSLARSSSINGSRPAYPASLAPSTRNAHIQAGRPPSRSASSVGAGSASASATSSSFVPPRGPIHVSKVPADKLRFFANDKKTLSSSVSAGSGRPGPGDAEYNPGESGIDDLLGLRISPQKPLKSPTEDVRSLNPPALTRHESMSNMSDMEEEEEWRPNTWHFGNASADKGKARSGANENSDASNVSSRGQSGILAPSDGYSGDVPPGTAYVGWNDAPSTHATIAKAYDGGKAYNKRQARKSNRLLYDLAAGLPPNPGAASKWARPIQFGDSLPSAPAGLSSRSNAISTDKPKMGSNPSARGFGKLLDDTIRGRISVEAAFEGAFEGVRAKTASSTGGDSLSAGSRRRAPLPTHNASPAEQQYSQQRRQTPQDGITRVQSPQHHGNGLRDPLSAPTSAPAQAPAATGLSKRRVEWTRGKAVD